MRIGIVNDLAMAVECLRRVLVAAPGLEIAWIAKNGREAVRCCAADRPDLVLMDLIMPELDGVEATKIIMKISPCPILIVTASVTAHCAQVFEAMGAGALDVVATPVLTAAPEGMERGGAILIEKIHRIAKAVAPTRGNSRAGLPARDNWASSTARNNPLPLIVIGASTGGPQALLRILAALPGDFPGALVVIQHMDLQFIDGLADWLNNHANIPVRVMKNGDRPIRGTVLIPKTAGHVILTQGQTFRYITTPEESPHRPAIDVFFHSVAASWEGWGGGILLTGMGRDGAEGLLALRQRGFFTIAQDEKTSIVFGMPQAACILGAAEYVLPLEDIAPMTVSRCNKKI